MKDNPRMSKNFQELKTVPLRQAQQLFDKRDDDVKAVNASIGNVSLPMHPAMQKRMFDFSKDPDLAKGVVKYSSTQGRQDTRRAFLKMIEASGGQTKSLEVLITNGASSAMDLVLAGTCQKGAPLTFFEPAYANYISISKKLRIPIKSIARTLGQDGNFTILQDAENIIRESASGALLLIPYDNPTGDIISQKELIDLAKICVKYNIWLVSDEAYRMLHYTKEDAPSIWRITPKEVPGIVGRRISIETISKGMNGCGLRIGAVVSDNKEFIAKAIIAYSSYLCAGMIDQYIVGSLANQSVLSLHKWYQKLCNYYQDLITSTTEKLKEALPNIILSKPKSAIYSVVDLRNLVPTDFNMNNFCIFCAQKGKIPIGKDYYTLLFAPLVNFYLIPDTFATYQIRLSYVASREKISLIPDLLKALLEEYLCLCHNDSS